MRNLQLALAASLLVAAGCGGAAAPPPESQGNAPSSNGNSSGEQPPVPAGATSVTVPSIPAATPPMGWNGWAHFQCSVDEQIVLANAQALVSSGLAAKGYDTVTVDDCWMAGSRDANGNLVADSSKFPHGMAWLGAQLHGMGLKYGIYEDAGAQTCGGFPGSGQPSGGGADHFAQDTQLFASWGVDYLKLDGCFLWIPPGRSQEQAYRDAYSAESQAIAATGRPIVFSESAPAYFFGQDNWTSVLGWVGQYGQLWRLGTDIRIYDSGNPGAERWSSMLNNYEYTKDMGRFTHPGNWNDPDFIIGGDPGLTADEARSQFTLWSMMSAPLILSSDLTQVIQSKESLAILGNSEAIAIDQDPLGQAASVTAGDAVDVLIKPLANGDRAVAFFNHGDSPTTFATTPDTLGFAASAGATYRIRDVWAGADVAQLSATLPSHGSALFRVSRTSAKP